MPMTPNQVRAEVEPIIRVLETYAGRQQTDPDLITAALLVLLLMKLGDPAP